MTVIFTISGMHCTSCGMLIDDAVEEVSGVRRSQTNFGRAQTTVEFDPFGVDPATIVAAIEAAGYKVESQTPAAGREGGLNDSGGTSALES